MTWFKQNKMDLIVGDLEKFYNDLLKEAQETTVPQKADKFQKLQDLGFNNVASVTYWKNKTENMKDEKDLIIKYNKSHPHYIFIPKSNMEFYAKDYSCNIVNPDSYFGDIPEHLQDEILKFAGKNSNIKYSLKVLVPRENQGDETFDNPGILAYIENEGYIYIIHTIECQSDHD